MAQISDKIRSKDELPVLSDEQIASNVMKGLLVFFKKTLLEEVQPRPSTGSIHVWKDNDIIGVQLEERLARVFNKLIVEGILSTPVLDVHRRYVETLELLDVVLFVADLFSEVGKGWTDEELQNFFEKESQFVEARVEQVLQRKKRQSAFPVQQGTNVLQGLALFQDPNVHRIPVLSSENRVVGFFTQSMAISLISQNVALLGASKDAKVADLIKDLPQEVLAVDEDEKTINVFRLLANKNISGVAIVNKSGDLTGTISIRDLRGIGNNAARWKRLALSVKAFKELVSSEFASQTPKEVLQVTMGDTLEKVIQLMDDGNLHRVFVVEGGKPKRVISQGDVLRFLARVAGLPNVTASATDAAVGPVPSPQGVKAAQSPPKVQPQAQQPAQSPLGVGVSAAQGPKPSAPIAQGQGKYEPLASESKQGQQSQGAI